MPSGNFLKSLAAVTLSAALSTFPLYAENNPDNSQNEFYYDGKVGVKVRYGKGGNSAIVYDLGDPRVSLADVYFSKGHNLRIYGKTLNIKHAEILRLVGKDGSTIYLGDIGSGPNFENTILDGKADLAWIFTPGEIQKEILYLRGTTDSWAKNQFRQWQEKFNTMKKGIEQKTITF